jgi:hypothetical protein
MENIRCGRVAAFIRVLPIQALVIEPGDLAFRQALVTVGYRGVMQLRRRRTEQAVWR